MTRGRTVLSALALVVALGYFTVPRAIGAISQTLTDLRITGYGQCGTAPCRRLIIGGAVASPTSLPNSITDLEMQSYVETATGIPAARIGFVDLAGNASNPPLTQTVNTTWAANTATTAETTLVTYSLPAGLLARNGMGVRLMAWGTTASNNNNKSVRTYFGSTFGEPIATTPVNNQAWRVIMDVYRTGATSQSGYASGTYASGTPFINNLVPKETLSGAVTLKITGQTSAASAADIQVNGYRIETIY